MRLPGLCEELQGIEQGTVTQSRGMAQRGKWVGFMVRNRKTVPEGEAVDSRAGAEELVVLLEEYKMVSEMDL